MQVVEAKAFDYDEAERGSRAICDRDGKSHDTEAPEVPVQQSLLDLIEFDGVVGCAGVVDLESRHGDILLALIEEARLHPVLIISLRTCLSDVCNVRMCGKEKVDDESPDNREKSSAEVQVRASFSSALCVLHTIKTCSSMYLT